MTPPLTRDEVLVHYAGLSRADLAFALELAETPAEVDAAAYLSLALFGVAGSLEEFAEHDYVWPSLQVLTVQARQRVDGFHGNSAQRTAELLNAGSEHARARRRSESRALWAQKEAAIQRLGYRNAVNH